jgi:4'-phosphopantetheinyl transferase
MNSKFVATCSIASPNDVVVWEVDMDNCETADLDLALLDSQETYRYNSFFHVRDKQRFGFAHTARRRILARHLGVHPSEIQYEYGAFGKPRLPAHRSREIVEFSFSHSGEMALLAISQMGPIGVDIEKITLPMDYTSLLSLVCTANEKIHVLAQPHELRYVEFLKFWTAKEAYLKGTGSGLAVEPTTVEINPNFCELKNILDIKTKRSSTWILYRVDVPDGYVACLAALQRPQNIVTRIYSLEFSE